MSTKLKIIDDTPKMEPEGDEFSFEGVTTAERKVKIKFRGGS